MRRARHYLKKHYVPIVVRYWNLKKRRGRKEGRFVCPNCNKVVDMTPGSDSGASHQIRELEVLTPEWTQHLQNKLTDLESRLQETESKLPNSSIISPKFWTRAWAVFGHQLSIGIVIYAIVFLLVFFANL